MMDNFSWTDRSFLVVLCVGLVLLILGLRRQQTRRSFLQIFRQPTNVSAAVVLLFFLIIGVLDCIPITRDSRISESTNHTNSLLDFVLAPLPDIYEKTYSAPLALVLFSTEALVNKGQVTQIHPRLTYPRVLDEKSKFQLIKKVLFRTLAISFLLVLGVWCVAMLIKRFVFYGKIGFSKVSLSGLVTLFVCLSVLIGGVCLSRHLHVLGTGKIGEDIFYYAMKSIRTGLVIGILTTLFMMPIALLLGICAGYFGGLVDDVIQYVYTTLSSIPGVLLITASVLSMQTYIANHPERFKTLAEAADARLLALCLILGITSWTSLCRLLRAETLKLREIDFVLAAKALGSGSFRIMWKHILPNVMHVVVITLVLDFSFLVLAEAVLSYVGVGVSPMTISWGNMINEARLELAREPMVWWPMMAAFLFMFVLVLSSNLFADAVRDAFDPRMKRE